MKTKPPRQPARRAAPRKAAAAPAQPGTPPEAPAPPPPVPFLPVPLRPRHDGWTPDRQAAFIQALGETGCVAEACAAVGMSEASAYRLRARGAAISFRNAWDAALDYAIRRLSDRALGRAINGVSVPVFFQGEQIGERVYYDERLTMFLLRYRDPLRYGKWRDKQEVSGHSEYDAARLHEGFSATRADAALPPGEQARAYRKRVLDIGRALAVERGDDPSDVRDPDAGSDHDPDREHGGGYDGGYGGGSTPAEGQEEGDVA